jgi:hypothetical protein
MEYRIYVDETVFDKIDTEEKAYWLGFIFADGNISDAYKLKEKTKKSIYRIEVSLKSDDINHLEKLKEFLKWQGTVKINKTNFSRCDRCRLYFNNKHIWETLNSYGCTPRKSLTLKFPNLTIFNDKNLIKDFIRGYIDGDGSISYLTYKKINKKAMYLRILGTEDMLINIQKNLPLERSNKIWRRDGENVYDLAFNHWRGYYVCNHLYKNATIYLDRKFNRYKEYCRLYEEL